MSVSPKVSDPDTGFYHATDHLECRSLTLVRGGRLVQVSLDLSVQNGDVVLLKGPNGVGKSTLIRAIAGLVQPKAGAVFRQGHDIKDDPGAHQQALTYIAHQDAVKPAMTVRENLSSWARDLSRVTLALEAFDLVALADISARLLSAGQKRRLGLARLVVEAAPLWLLDEPAVSLDKASVARLTEMIAAHRASGGMVIAATHGDILPENATDFHLERPDEDLLAAWSEVSWI